MQTAALYIHIPWCIQKCPYCDFNSHKSPAEIAERAYINHLAQDFKTDIERFGTRTITSIFIGGGTPSLFSANAYEELFERLNTINSLDKNIEITMEANPGTVEQSRFFGYRQAGINRLSLGIQSFNPVHLKKLGRIHDAQQAHRAIHLAREAGFDNINLDIMHGLPDQNIQEGLKDLQTAMDHRPEHLSWYQLTLEPNTLFYKRPPTLPDEDAAFELEQHGLALLREHGYNRYEISAFCRSNMQSQHNVNYWTFGDYLGIGAGAHGKITDRTSNTVFRTQKKRQPDRYQQDSNIYTSKTIMLNEADICFEYMLNTTRLEASHFFSDFDLKTGISIKKLMSMLNLARKKGFITMDSQQWSITPLGRQFTNDLQALFLSD